MILCRSPHKHSFLPVLWIQFVSGTFILVQCCYSYFTMDFFHLTAQVELSPSHMWLHLCWLDDEQRYTFLRQPLAKEGPCFQTVKDKQTSQLKVTGRTRPKFPQPIPLRQSVLQNVARGRPPGITALRRVTSVTEAPAPLQDLILAWMFS